MRIFYVIGCLFITSVKSKLSNYLQHNYHEAQTIINGMTVEEKIGQFFMVGSVIDSTSDPINMALASHRMDPASVIRYITDYHVGGVLFLGKSSYESQKILTQEYQRVSALPLLIGQDLEWGLGMRLIDQISFPRAMTLGALADTHRVYEVAHAIGLQMHTLGVHINFAPVADVNSDPKNPIIHMRSFGSFPDRVYACAEAYARGIHDAGRLACAKHFPGHGNTDTDSHYTLPTLDTSEDEFTALDLMPFKKLADASIDSIMMGHISVPALDPMCTPASLSKPLIQDLLQATYHYHGLIITDALNMGALRERYTQEEIITRSFLAGAHLLVCPDNVDIAVATLRHLYQTGIIDEITINERLTPLIQAKLWVHSQQPYEQTIENNRLIQHCYQESITVINHDTNMIPLSNVKQYAWIRDAQKEMHLVPSTYSIDYYDNSMIDDIDYHHYDEIIISLYPSSYNLQELCGVSRALIASIHDIAQSHRVIMIIYGSPYCASWFSNEIPLIIGYESHSYVYDAVHEVLIGARKPAGKLPINL